MDEYKLDADPEKWSVLDVRRWLLEDVDWKRYADDFEEEEIDGKALNHLTVQNLADYGVKSIHRSQLIREIRQLFFKNDRAPYNASNSSYSSEEEQEKDDEEGFTFPSWFEILVDALKVREECDTDSRFVKKLLWGKRVKVVERSGRRMRIVDPVDGWVSWMTAQGKKILAPVTAGYDSNSDFDDETTIQEIANRRRKQRGSPEPTGDRVDRWGANIKRHRSSLQNLMSSRDDLTSPRNADRNRDEDSDRGRDRSRDRRDRGRDRSIEREASSDEERVRGLKARIKKHDEDRAVFHAETSMSENQLAYLNNKLDLASSEVTELRDQIHDKDREVENLKRELRETRERDSRDLRDELEEVEKKRDDLLYDKEQAEDKVSDLEKKLAEMAKEFDSYKKKYKPPAHSDDEDYYRKPKSPSGAFSKTRRYSNDSLDDRPRRYSNESPRDSKDGRTRGRANSDDIPRQRRRLSSDEGEGNIAISRGPEHNYREDSPGALYQKTYSRRTPGDDTYVETGVDEEFDERDRYDTPSKMKSSSDPEFDEDWSSKSSKRNNSPAWRATKYDDDDDMNEAERRAWRRGKEDYSWFVKYDAKGKPYYYNVVTRHKRNDKPGTLDSCGQLKIHDPVILCEYDGIWYKAQLLEPDSRENWWVRFDCGDVKRASINREHIRKWVAWLEEEY